MREDLVAQLYRQRGLGVVEVIVVVLVLVVALLLVAMYAQQKTDEKQVISDQQQAIASDDAAVPSPSSASDRSLATVEQFFKTYAKRSEDAASGRAEPINTMSLQREFPYHISEVASRQVSENKSGVDPVLCAQNVPTSFEFSKPEAEGNQTEITVSGKFEGGEGKTIVWVDQESNRITKFTCDSL